MTSSIPPASPAAIRFVYKSSKTLGCFFIASARVLPCSTSFLTCSNTFAKNLFSCWEASMSRHCTRGSPASIITENCLVNIASSLSFTLPPKPNTPVDFFSLKDVRISPCCLKRFIASSLFLAFIVPALVSPDLVLALYSKIMKSSRIMYI